jgi:hypothetical protein
LFALGLPELKSDEGFFPEQLHESRPAAVSFGKTEMKHDTYLRAVLTVIAAALVVVAARPFLTPQPAAAIESDYTFLHFDPEVTKISKPDGSADVIGRVAIDLRNGDIYGFPTENLGYPRNPAAGKPGYSRPIYLGRFEFDEIRPRR